MRSLPLFSPDENPMTSPTSTTTTSTATEHFNMNTFFEEYITYAITGALLTCFLLVVFIIACITCCCGCWKCSCRPKPRRPIVNHQYMENMNKRVGNQEETYMYADYSAPYTTPAETGTYSTSIWSILWKFLAPDGFDTTREFWWPIWKSPVNLTFSSKSSCILYIALIVKCVMLFLMLSNKTAF